jgi:alpha-galactosidase
VIGSNTVGHLAAGLFSIQRTGDDTSGKWWERTRYMGVNTLAFRMPQHGTFYSHDADCVGLTADVPWELNRRWLRLLAGSGTPLFVSAAPAAVTKEQEAELRRAFEQAAIVQPAAEPLDWLRTTCPSRWVLNGEEAAFEWNAVTVETLEEKDNGWWL